MFDFVIARFLYRFSSLISALEGENYRAKAFFKAALAVDGYGMDIYNVYKQKKLSSIPGIGIKIEKYIIEIIETNNLKDLRLLQDKLPDSIYDILDLTPLNNIIKQKIVANKIYNIVDLKSNIKLKGIFSKIEKEKISKAIDEYERECGKYQFAHADAIAKGIIDYLKQQKTINKCDIVGQLRRKEELVTDIEIVLSGQPQSTLPALLKKCPLIAKFKVGLDNKYEAIGDLDIPVYIYGVPQDFFYYNLFCLTGHSNFIADAVAKRELNPNFFKGCKSEEEVFERLNLSYVMPELRYKTYKGVKKSNLISMADFKGDLHAHTNWSDGINSLEELVNKAKELDFDYIGISDHSISLRIGNGLSHDELIKQVEVIKKLNKKNKGFKILSAIEVEIKVDGSLDYPDYILDQLDYVIGAIHSGFNQSKEQMMKRLEKALSNKYINILAHPTGRLLGKPGKIFARRQGLNIDFNLLLDICKQNQVALEINAFPERFDLNREKVSLAIKKGVKLTIGTDAHSITHLPFYKYGIDIARSAGASKKDILNTYSYIKLKNFFNQKRKRLHNDSQTIPYAGIKNYHYYFGDNKGIIEGDKTVVGIDLTSSSKKATGWAFLRKNKVITKLLITDEQLVEETIKYNPDIISIDSPLSIPAGRCCPKDDCHCRKIGIMRYCEKTLMRMRIGVFPCLLPSMAGLTERGIKLAALFRKKGYEVIESYPGVAQDILQINRKNRGINNLIRGLEIFGIRGDISKKNIVHDEVDAITSALVGYFYLNNQYIPLGNEAENYLIIPRISSHILTKPIIIGLAGEVSVGKTILAEYLRFKYGFKYQKVDTNISINQAIKGFESNNSYIVDYILNDKDLAVIKGSYQSNFFLIYIDASFNNCFKRYKKEMDNDITKEAFEEKCTKDANALSLAFMADYRINNNKSFIDMYSQVDKILMDIYNKVN